jgi:hypothetical protein
MELIVNFLYYTSPIYYWNKKSYLLGFWSTLELLDLVYVIGKFLKQT